MALPGKGRDMVLRLNGVAVAGIRTKSFVINGEPIDITSDDDLGWRKLLDAPGEIQVNISFAGVTKSDALLQIALNKIDRINPFQIVRPDGGVLSGDFFLSNYQESAEYQGASMIEGELQSSGEISYSGT